MLQERMRHLLFFFAFLPSLLPARTPKPFESLSVLLGTWEAKAAVTGSTGASVLGAYTFQSDLGGTVVTRTGSADSRKGPGSFDCQHHDALIVYRNPGESALHAFYADRQVSGSSSRHNGVHVLSGVVGNEEVARSVSQAIQLPGAEMNKAFCVIVSSMLVVPLWLLAQPEPEVSALASMLGKSRPLLIFYARAPGVRALGVSPRRQLDLIEGHERELKERGVEVVWVPDRDAVEQIPDGARRIPRAYGLGLRRRFHIDDRRFTVVLVGKDGGEKFRSHTPVTIEKLDALIDAMPMRQQEMRDGHHTE